MRRHYERQVVLPIIIGNDVIGWGWGSWGGKSFADQRIIMHTGCAVEPNERLGGNQIITVTAFWNISINMTL